MNGSGTSWPHKNAGTQVPLMGSIYKVSVKAIAKTPGLYFTITLG